MKASKFSDYSHTNTFFLWCIMQFYGSQVVSSYTLALFYKQNKNKYTESQKNLKILYLFPESVNS